MKKQADSRLVSLLPDRDHMGRPVLFVQVRERGKEREREREREMERESFSK